MQTTVRPALEELASLRHQHPYDGTETPIGDFEMPLEVLQLLISQEQIQDVINLVLETDPLSSLFDYELGRIKPPPPPPLPKPKPSKKKGAKVLKIAEPGGLDTAPGFRAPRTRRALAAAATFEAEATSVVVDEQMVQTDGEEAAKKPTKMRAAGVRLMVEDVDSQDSFKRFDAGWILPSGQKRGGRQPVERHPLPPPKKRMRTCAYDGMFLLVTDSRTIVAERGTSKLSTISTAASENQTIYGTIPPEEAVVPSGSVPEQTEELEVLMDVEQPEPSVLVSIPALEPISEPIPEPLPKMDAEPELEHPPELEPAPEMEPVPEFVPEPELETAPLPVTEPEPEPKSMPPPEAQEKDVETELAARIAAIPRDQYTNIITVGGKIIIEELDTPATRREKASRRKAEKKAAAAAATAVHTQSRVPEKNNGHESDLSSLSELESDEEGGGGSRHKERAVKAPPPAVPVGGPSTAPHPAEPGVPVLPESKTLEGGTLGAHYHVILISLLICTDSLSLGQSKYAQPVSSTMYTLTLIRYLPVVASGCV